jgi:hypothetical protein
MYHQPLHLIRSVEGLLPSSPGASPSLGCLPLVSRLGCPSSTPGRGIPFPDCLLLFSRLGYPGSTPSRGIPFPGCLLLFSGLSCPGSAHGGSIHLPGCINARGGGSVPITRCLILDPLLITDCSKSYKYVLCKKF